MRVLKVDEVADMLGCTPDTVREKTPGVLPGVKFGRDWVYVESQVVEVVAHLAAVESQSLRRERRDAVLPELRSQISPAKRGVSA